MLGVATRDQEGLARLAREAVWPLANAGELSNPSRRHFFSPHVCPLYRMTLGLDRLWSQLHASAAGPPPRRGKNCLHCRDSGFALGTVGVAGQQRESEREPGDPGSLELCPQCDAPAIFAERYEIIRELESGHFSQVFLVKDLFQPGWDDGQSLRVVKLLKAGLEILGGAEEHWLKQLEQVDESLGGRLGLVACFGRIWHGDRLGLVLEYLRPPPSSAFHCVDRALMSLRRLIVDVANLLDALHSPPLSALHADVKLENILYGAEEDRYKLIDFGNCVPLNRLDEYREGFEIQSLLYRAPEVLVGYEIDRSADIWSLGIVSLQFIKGVFGEINVDAEADAKVTTGDPATRSSKSTRSASFYPSPPSTSPRLSARSRNTDQLKAQPLPPFRSTSRNALLAEIAELMGPYPNTFKTGKFYLTEAAPLMSAFPEHSPAFWQRWRKSNISRMVRVRDAKLVDLLAKMLECDPARRPSAREVLLHPFLSPLVPYSAKAPSLPADLDRPEDTDFQFRSLVDDMLN